jgi:ABC-2 type transport system ATP-binding protein
VDSRAKMNRLSKGEARRIQLLLALGHRPRLLLLDEPTDGLDPAAREKVLGILAEHMSDSPTTVLVSTHLIYEMDGLADHVGVLQNGKMRAQMRRDELELKMRSYSLEVPEQWNGEHAARGGVHLVRKSVRKREVEWMVWGDEASVAGHLRQSGATVRDISAVSLEDAAIALMAEVEEVA